MAINLQQLNERVIVPVLDYLGLYSDAARNLILGTFAQESGLGTYIIQKQHAIARGIGQAEENTCKLLEEWYEKNDLDKWDLMLDFALPSFSVYEQLCGNLYLATALCRLHYYNIKTPLPSKNDVHGLAIYWKKYYNTIHGKGTVEQFVNNYYKYGNVIFASFLIKLIIPLVSV